MTRIDFYILDATGEQARYHFACLLAEKAWHKHHRVYVHATDNGEARRIDTLLWRFRDSSFLPHSLIGTDDPPAPVEIGSGEEPDGHNDVMINLAQGAPPFVDRFRRVSEIVLRNPESTGRLRERWRSYREQGHELHHHEISRSRLGP